MHQVRGIADQRQAIRHHRARQMHFQRPYGARPGQLDAAQAIAEALLDLGEEAGVVERHDGPALRAPPPST